MTRGRDAAWGGPEQAPAASQHSRKRCSGVRGSCTLLKSSCRGPSPAHPETVSHYAPLHACCALPQTSYLSMLPSLSRALENASRRDFLAVQAQLRANGKRLHACRRHCTPVRGIEA